MTKYIPVIIAAFAAVMFTLGAAQAQQAIIVPTNPPDKCYNAENLETDTGVSLYVYDMEETITLVRRFIPATLYPQLPHPATVSGSMASHKEGTDRFVFTFLDTNGCSMQPMFVVAGQPPLSKSNTSL